MAANHHIRSSTRSSLSYSEGFMRDLFYGDGEKFNVRGDPGSASRLRRRGLLRGPSLCDEFAPIKHQRQERTHSLDPINRPAGQ